MTLREGDNPTYTVDAFVIVVFYTNVASLPRLPLHRHVSLYFPTPLKSWRAILCRWVIRSAGSSNNCSTKAQVWAFQSKVMLCTLWQTYMAIHSDGKSWQIQHDCMCLHGDSLGDDFPQSFRIREFLVISGNPGWRNINIIYTLI